MAGDIYLKAGTATTHESSGGSISAAARVVATTNLDNVTIKDPFALFEAVVTFSVAPTVGRRVSLILIPSIDGTNFADGDASVAPGANMIEAWAFVRAVTSAQRLLLRGPHPGKRQELLPLIYKAILQNDADQTISSGWTLKSVTARWQYT